MVTMVLVLGFSIIIPTFFTKRKWDIEKENGVFGYTIWEFFRMWFWIWMASLGCLGGIVSLFL
jgi:hypothetical protein